MKILLIGTLLILMPTAATAQGMIDVKENPQLQTDGGAGTCQGIEVPGVGCVPLEPCNGVDVPNLGCVNPWPSPLDIKSLLGLRDTLLA
jgi:hypothetical protein